MMLPRQLDSQRLLRKVVATELLLLICSSAANSATLNIEP
jgi:hypothetical protein